MRPDMRHLCTVLWPLMAFIAAAPPAHAGAALYRWFDDSGQVHFGDQPPPGVAQRAERLPVPAYAPPDQPAEADPYSILNQLRRLEESRDRLARERHEQQQRDREYQLRLRELQAREDGQPPPFSGVPVYAYPYPHRPPHGPAWPVEVPRPWSLWKPDHPAYRVYPPPRAAVPRVPQGREGFDLPR